MSGMQGKVVVLTGGTSGIGQAAALRLAQMGARLVLVARDASRAKATLKRLRTVSPAAAHTAHLADLSLVSETKRVAREIAAAEPRIDVLINNAGLICARRQVTAERYELTFATNHLAYFVLTHGLLPRLLDSAPARIVNTASEVHRARSSTSATYNRSTAIAASEPTQNPNSRIFYLPMSSPGVYPARG